jgi:two-component system sensor histidine kinase/response regulator
LEDETIESASAEHEIDHLRLRIAELEAHLASARAHASARSTPKRVSSAARIAAVEAQGDSNRARAILASMLDPTISIDDIGTIQAVSDSVQRVFGYSPRELVGQNIRLLMPEPHRSAHDGYLERYRRTGAESIIGRTRQFEVVCKDGRTITCALSVSRADPDVGPAVFTGTFRDVTELERATRALAESERRFHAIFDQTFQFIGLLDPEGRVLEVNRTALDSVRAVREQIIGRFFWETPWWSHSAELRARVEQAVAAAARGAFVRFEAQHVDSAGMTLEIDFSLKPVKDENDHVVLLLPEGRDVSELKRAQRTETAMLRAFATIGESAALLAHEIKNPITAVNVALRAVATELGEDHKVVLEDLIARMQRIEQMMRRTLSFARPIELRECDCDARVLFEAVAANLKSAIGSAQAIVHVRVPAAGVRFKGDPALLQDVLSNLVTNAIEARAEGAQVTLTAARSKDGTTVLAVEDNGPGIPESLHETLFKPFVTTKHKGNGLGLAICRKILEEHGGSLDFDRGRRSGARFEITLPPERRIR